MYLSKFFHVPAKTFKQQKVYNALVQEDSKLHIDPLLLKECTIPEFTGSYNKFLDRFRNIFRCATYVKTSSIEKDIFYKRMFDLLTFHEIPNTGLGYSQKGTHGTGISGHLTLELADTTLDIIHAGIQDPEIFAIMPLFQDNFGADRLSDMTISILYEDFLHYTERISRSLSLKPQSYKYQGELYMVPYIKDHPLILIPSIFLCDLPIARSYDEIDDVCDYNRFLRQKICKAIGFTWKDFSKLHKRDLKKYVLNKNIWNDLCKCYKDLYGVPYDFINDKLCEYKRIDIDECLNANYPLNLKEYKTLVSSEEVFELTKSICKQYKQLIEKNRMYQLIYDNNGNIRKEKYAQLLFFTVAQSYCSANDIDLNRESDCGIGELDFKLSQGNHAKILIEIKYTSNPKLKKGLTSQLGAYMSAEKAQYGILLVLKNRDNDDKKINQLLQEAHSQPNNANTVIVVDAVPKKSASHL
jgi:hypothetical protein